MASSSNSQVKSSYDIFLSFRGENHKKFIGYLNEALEKEGFGTFVANDDINRGHKIKSELREAICNSKMSIIVLSKNYAKSTACLFEAQKIIEHHKEKSDYFILPVFYEVDPGEIKEQAKNLDFGGKKVTAQKAKRKRTALERIILPLLFMMDPEDINEQEEHFDFGGKEVTVEQVKLWSAALKEVASMAGMFSGDHSNRYEFEFIDEIVGVVKSKRDGDYLDLDEDMKYLNTKVEFLDSQKNDINSKISSDQKRQPWERPKAEVGVWLKYVQRFKEDVESLQQKVVGETNVYLRICLKKAITKKILEVSELEKKGRDLKGLLIDEFPTGRLILPLTNVFVEDAKAKNVENIWKCLMNDDVKPIGVYGMGGVGKTTTMTHIHNQLLRKEEKFDNVYWVTVSKPFDISNLQSDIAKVLNLNLGDDKDVKRRASLLNFALSVQKRYVLILDDVWVPFALETVGIPEPMICQRCKLVLTTRSLEVCESMNCTPVKVNPLTEEEALDLFLRMAGGYDTVLDREMQEVAARIAKKCACLPLAIVTVARSLRGSKRISKWRTALNELISATKDSSDDYSKVLECLKFSYSHLGGQVFQDCFLYCSLYPEDHNIPVNELIEYWIAEGLIAAENSVEVKFDKGHTVLEKLTSSCLLENCINNSEDCVRVHDLIRDMALRITSTSPRFMVKAGERLTSIPCEDWSEDLDRISFMHSRITELPTGPPVCPRLTTLLLNRTRLSKIADCFFTNMPCLKVLDLSWNDMKSLPKSISNLENLHALILAHCQKLEYVPSLKKLKKLEEFKLTSSRIEELPEGIEDLDNIRKLDLSCNERLRRFPSWKLRVLDLSWNERLRRFPSWKLRVPSKLQYLKFDRTEAEVSAKDLLCLKQLNVVSVNFQNVQELTKYVKSQQFQGLEKYFLRVGRCDYSWSTFLKRGVSISSKSVAFGRELDLLELPANINDLQLYGIYYPFSLSAIPGFKHVIDLCRCEIRRCEGLESIFSTTTFDIIGPPYNIHFNLKEMYIIECDAVKNIFSIQLLQNFPNLEKIVVWKCKNVEGIFVENGEMSGQGHHQGGSNKIAPSKLKVLDLRDLPRLKSMHNGVMVCQSIEQVIVFKCPTVRRLPFSLRMDNEQGTAPPTLKSIEAGEKWWESLEWDDPLTKTLLQPYVRYYDFDIFLSFCGPDTDTKFTDHLYKALKQEGFYISKDREGIETGETINTELHKAIEYSKISMVVLSQNYAKSKTCLFEIKTIIEHHKADSNHHILPIFYEVDPVQIREQARNLENLAAVTGKEVDFGGKKVKVEELKQWSAALKMIASLPGMVSGNQSQGYQAKFIKEIVEIVKWKWNS